MQFTCPDAGSIAPYIPMHEAHRCRYAGMFQKYKEHVIDNHRLFREVLKQPAVS